MSASTIWNPNLEVSRYSGSKKKKKASKKKKSSKKSSYGKKSSYKNCGMGT